MDEAERPTRNFPGSFSIKAVGKDENDFAAFVQAIVESVVISKSSVKHKVRASKNGVYVSVTLNFAAASQEEYDLVFSTVNAADRVLWVL